MYGLLVPGNRSSVPRYKATAGALVQEYSKVSALQASDFYDDMRALAGLSDGFTVALAESPSEERIDASIDWSIEKLFEEDPDLAATQTKTEGVLQKLVADTGRETILDAVDEDKRASAWARHVDPGACYFCALLSTRGAVYHTEQTARFSAHDHCHCLPVPVFEGQEYEPDAHIKQWNRLYASSTGHVSGADKINAFRRAFDSARSG